MQPRGSLKRKLLSASFLSVLDQLLKVASALIISPVIINGLGMEGYGLWVLAVSIAAYADLLDMGQSLSAVRFYSQAIGRHDDSLLGGFYYFLRRRYVRTAVFICACGLAVTCAGLFQPGETSTPNLGEATGILLITAGVCFPFRAPAAILKARLAYTRITGVGLARLLVFSALILWLGTDRLSVGRMLALQCTLQVLEQLTLFLFARRLTPAKRPQGYDLPVDEQRAFITLARQYATGYVAITFRSRFDTPLLGGYAGLPAVSQYSVGLRFPTLFADLVNAAFGGHLMAAFSQAAARGGGQAVLPMLFKTLRWSSLVSMLGAAMIFSFGPAFLRCWLGTGFEPAEGVLQALIVGNGLLAAQYPVFAFLSAINAYGTYVKISITTALFNLALSWILVQHLGLMGVVWATTLESLIQALALVPWLAATAAQIPLAEYFQQVFWRHLLPFTALFFSFCLAVSSWVKPHTYFQLAGCAAAAGSVGVMVAWCFLLTRDERHQAMNWLRAKCSWC